MWGKLRSGQLFQFKFKVILSLFILASRNGYLSIVQQILENQADVNIQNKSGRTPLMWGKLRPNLFYLNLNAIIIIIHCSIL